MKVKKERKKHGHIHSLIRCVHVSLYTVWCLLAPNSVRVREFRLVSTLSDTCLRRIQHTLSDQVINLTKAV